MRPIPPYSGKVIDPENLRVKSKGSFIGVGTMLGRSMNQRGRYLIQNQSGRIYNDNKLSNDDIEGSKPAKLSKRVIDLFK